MIVFIVISFNLLLLNLIIAILANTYNLFDLRSTGLYLSKILNTRGELLYEENYGAYLAAVPPLNVIQVPFIPIALIMRKGHPTLKKINYFVMQTSYCTFMLIFFVLFIVVSVVLIPFAWLIAIYDKRQSKNVSLSKMDKIANLIFIPLGVPMLFLDVMSDLIYFWRNNFRDNLKQNIIVKKKSLLMHGTLKDLDIYESKLVKNKIKSVSSSYLIRHFRSRFNVIQNIQFIMFG